MIYCVEDDRNIRELVCYTLSASGFDTKGYRSGEELSEALKTELPELILLDIMLPGRDGMEILKELKSHRETRDIPVIMLTAKSAEYDKVMGLDGGADDYVTKPFGMMEFVSRVKAVLRRSSKDGTDKGLLSVGAITLDLYKHKVRVGGVEVVLTLKEYELLRYLMENAGIVLTRDQILLRVWNYDYSGETRTVDVHVRTLRSKLLKAESQIKTVRGVGYSIENE